MVRDGGRNERPRKRAGSQLGRARGVPAGGQNAYDEYPVVNVLHSIESGRRVRGARCIVGPECVLYLYLTV